MCIIILTASLVSPSFTTFAEEQSTEEHAINFALPSNGASYVIYQIDSKEQEIEPSYYGNFSDDGYTKLTDGTSAPGFNDESCVAFAGTGKHHKIKFDLGRERKFNKIILRNVLLDTLYFNTEWQPLDPNYMFAVSIEGNKVDASFDMKFNASFSDERFYGYTYDFDVYSYDVIVTFSAVYGRYADISFLSSTYLQSLDEIEIYFDENVTVTTIPETSSTDPALPSGNHALASNGGRYVISTLNSDGSEGDPAWLDDVSADTDFTRLNNGITNSGIVDSESVCLKGTARTHRFKFDLGTVRKNVSKVLVKNVVCSTEATERPAINSCKVSAGKAASMMEYVWNDYFSGAGSNETVDIIVEFDPIDARYVFIELTPACYVLSLDEIEIYGEAVDNPVMIRGDANGDGEIDSLDATLALKYDAGNIDFDAAQLASSDVNNDGEADSLDATLILKYDAGLIDDFISYETEPSDNEMPDSAFLSSEDIVKLVSMDQTDRKAITSFIQSAALLDDESCREFTEILYSTDIITVDGKLPTSIVYYPESENLTVIYTVSPSMHWYCFEYILNGETAENRLNTEINTENSVTYNEKLKLLYIPEIEDKDIARHNSYCWVQINGKLAKGTYCNKNVEITNDIWDSMFSSEVIISPLLKEN